jgi:hypothetical protein
MEKVVHLFETFKIIFYFKNFEPMKVRFGSNQIWARLILIRNSLKSFKPEPVRHLDPPISIHVPCRLPLFCTPTTVHRVPLARARTSAAHAPSPCVAHALPPSPVRQPAFAVSMHCRLQQCCSTAPNRDTPPAIHLPQCGLEHPFYSLPPPCGILPKQPHRCLPLVAPVPLHHSQSLEPSSS